MTKKKNRKKTVIKTVPVRAFTMEEIKVIQQGFANQPVQIMQARSIYDKCSDELRRYQNSLPNEKDNKQ